MSDLTQGERIAVLEAKVETLEETIQEMRDDLKHVRSVLDTAKGGWRMLLLVGTVMASLGAGAAWLLSHFRIFGGTP